MTDADWKIVETCLTSEFNPVGLICDGYHACLRVKRIRMRLVIVFLINGEFKGVWMSDDCEERRRFHRPVKRTVWDPKVLAMIKRMSAAEQRRRKVDPKETSILYYPWWTDFKALKRHLIKNNTSIELAPDWKYEAAMGAL